MQTKRQIITTADGSKTIYFPDLDENYHSHNGALQESVHIFIKNGIRHFATQTSIHIFEVGFGTGLNALLTADFAQNNTVKTIYHTIEAFPIALEEVEALNYASLFEVEKIKDLALGLHQLPWGKEMEVDDYFQFKKIHDKLENYSLENNFYDCVFFDAFAPAIQEELWTTEIFSKIFQALKPGGLLVTYCAKGQVKRDLKSVGFTVESTPGPPGKREITLAWK